MKFQGYLITIILLLIIPQPVSAYLDPGFANMVWQMIAAVGFAIVFTIKIYWQKIKDFFSRSKAEKMQE